MGKYYIILYIVLRIRLNILNTNKNHSEHNKQFKNNTDVASLFLWKTVWNIKYESKILH